MALTKRNMGVKELERKANLIRRNVIQTFYRAGGGHFGGSLSATDILTALYFHTMRVDPKNPKLPERDRFILSKGHAGIALACTLAEAGFFPEAWLKTYGDLDSPITTHPDVNLTPGVDMSTGSLGHGLAVASGMALAARIDGKGFKVFTLIGDGESHEGSIWEAAMAASHYELDNLTVFTDYNKLTMESRVNEAIRLEPLVSKWEAFGWAVHEIDGHDMGQIVAALETLPIESKKPSMIIAHTVKGKGLPISEDEIEWHWNTLGEAEYKAAMEHLEAVYDQ